MFELTMERELEDSLSEHEIAAGRNSRDRRSVAVRDVTPPHFNFSGPEWRQKIAFMLGGIRRIPGSCHEAVRVAKTLAQLPCRLEDPGLVARDLCVAHPARWLAPQLSPPLSPRLLCPWRKRAIDEQVELQQQRRHRCLC